MATPQSITSIPLNAEVPTTTKSSVVYVKDTSSLRHIINPARERAALAVVKAQEAREEKEETAKAAKEANQAQKEADQVAKKAKKEADQLAKQAKKEADQLAKKAQKGILATAALDEATRVLSASQWIHSHRAWLTFMQAKHGLTPSQLKLLCGAVHTRVAAAALEGLLELTPAKPTPAAGLHYFLNLSIEEFLMKNKPAWRRTTTVAEARKSPPVDSAKEPDVQNVAPEAPAVGPGTKLTFAQRQLLTRAFSDLSHHKPLVRSESTNTIFKSLSPQSMGSPVKPAQGAKCRELTERYERLFNKNPTWHSATNDPSAPAGYDMETWQTVHTPSPVGTPKTPSPVGTPKTPNSAGSPDSPAVLSPAQMIKRSRLDSPIGDVWNVGNVVNVGNVGDVSNVSTPDGTVVDL